MTSTEAMSNSWNGAVQYQKEAKQAQPTVKSTVSAVSGSGCTPPRKMSEDDDDASDSEKMVICIDESAGN